MTSRLLPPRRLARLALAASMATTLSAGQEPVDRAMIERIREEGTARSKAGAYFDHFVTVVGPRLTGTPAHKASAEWAREQLAAAGLSDPHLEPFNFGRGWELTGFTLEMTSPRYMPLIGYPEGWSAPTAGALEGTPLFLGDKTGADVEQLKPSLKGAIVLSQPIQSEFVRADRAQPSTAAEKVTIGAPPMPGTRRSPDDTRRVTQALRESGAGVLLRPNAGEHGTMFVLGRDAGANAMPSVVLAAEHYNMIARMIAAGVPVRLRVKVDSRYLETDKNSYNVIADLPGTDPTLKDEIVLVGGHLDSWHSAPGATDNADGAAVVMEAARILKAIGARPKRTIRFALWSGEEEGLLGSKAYVAQHLEGPAQAAARDKFNVYFNIDPGAGPVYGFYLQGQDNVAPIFDAWLEPFKSMGARKNVVARIGNTDHLSFTAVGLPGFNPIQDYVNYDVRTHHTNMDTPERVRDEDLRQAAIVFASFGWQAATREARIPRPPAAATAPR
ncbi:MAG: M20/M25/M40 family metallo-hydrolase [Vicinamibacterales bacterium]